MYACMYVYGMYMVYKEWARFARSLLYLCAAYYCACAIDDLYLHIYAYAHE